MAGIGAMIVLSVLAASAVNGLQHGKVQIGGSAAANGFYCKTVTFPSPFTGSDSIKVFTSLSLGSISSRVHDVGFMWTESVTTSGFKVCVVESGTGFEGDARVNWVAYQVPESCVAEGSTRFNDFTTGTKCNRVPIIESFPSKPKVFVTARHNVLNRRQDAAAVWVEDISRDEFTICLREARTFDGRHKDIEAAWMALTYVPPSWSQNEIITLHFPNSLQPREEDNDAFCQIVNFTNPYFFPPSIVLTPNYEYKCSDEDSVRSNYNSIVAWNEEITKTSFKSCVKDLVGLNRCKRHPITVDYMVISDPDPCINKTCDYFALCKAVSPGVARCVCNSECPTDKNLVCATNGKTFDNMCIMKREICRTQGTFTFYHAGACQVDLKFPRKSITDYVITKTLPAMSAMTFCFWMKTTDTGNKGTPFGYNLKHGAIDEIQPFDYKNFRLYLNGDSKSMGISANDGKWHQICATWSSTDGSWVAYKDGKSAAQGTSFKKGYKIPAGGTLIVGQEQDNNGIFDVLQSFIGELTELNIWNRVLGPSEISKMSGACHSGEGNVLSWSDVLSGSFKGQVQKIQPSSCK